MPLENNHQLQEQLGWLDLLIRDYDQRIDWDELEDPIAHLEMLDYCAQLLEQLRRAFPPGDFQAAHFAGHFNSKDARGRPRQPTADPDEMRVRDRPLTADEVRMMFAAMDEAKAQRLRPLVVLAPEPDPDIPF